PGQNENPASARIHHTAHDGGRSESVGELGTSLEPVRPRSKCSRKKSLIHCWRCKVSASSCATPCFIRQLRRSRGVSDDPMEPGVARRRGHFCLGGRSAGNIVP